MTKNCKNFNRIAKLWNTLPVSTRLLISFILGDPGADKGGEGKSKRAEKYIWNEKK